MADRFEEMARWYVDRLFGGGRQDAVNDLSEMFRAESKRAQEAMRKAAKEYVDGLYAGQPESIASAGLRFTIMCGIETLPIEEQPTMSTNPDIPAGYMLVPIELPNDIIVAATPAVDTRDKPANMVDRCWRMILTALQAKAKE